MSRRGACSLRKQAAHGAANAGNPRRARAVAGRQTSAEISQRPR
jgi:hypothetical protein